VESPPEEPETPAEEEQSPAPTRGPRKVPPSVSEKTDAIERKPMSRLRRRIAERLVEAQRTAAILTTFNEIDLSRLLAARERLRARFRERHGVDLRLVSLFGRACLQALAEVPILNARIEGDDGYHRHVHLGIAVSTPAAWSCRCGDADRRASSSSSGRSRPGAPGPGGEADAGPAAGEPSRSRRRRLRALLSTILNPPQSGIPGMHKIDRGWPGRDPAHDSAAPPRPPPVDGEQAVTFLAHAVRGVT
jgi:2-oxoglutarate dehydrogenase E2 component (dihydrolipoamide succinyltransferase)